MSSVDETITTRIHRELYELIRLYAEERNKTFVEASRDIAVLFRRAMKRINPPPDITELL